MRMTLSRSFALAALVAVVSLAGARPASALPIFTTEGVFNPGGTNVLDLGDGATLTFDGVTDAEAEAPVVTDLGTFTLSVPDGTTITSLAPTTFQLTLTQSTPAAAPIVITGTLNLLADLTSNSGVLTIDFPQSFFSTVPLTYTYQLVNLTNNTTLFLNVPVEGTSGITTLQAFVVPEPSSILMIGMGLVGAAGYGWRRRHLSAA